MHLRRHWRDWTVLEFESLEALRQVFKEQEENEQAKETTKAEIESIRAERLALEKRKQSHREQLDRERLELLKEREQRAKAKEQQQAEQISKDNMIYLFSLFLTFASILASFILFLAIVLEY